MNKVKIIQSVGEESVEAEILESTIVKHCEINGDVGERLFGPGNLYLELVVCFADEKANLKWKKMALENEVDLKITSGDSERVSLNAKLSDFSDATENSAPRFCYLLEKQPFLSVTIEGAE